MKVRFRSIALDSANTTLQNYLTMLKWIIALIIGLGILIVLIVIGIYYHPLMDKIKAILLPITQLSDSIYNVLRSIFT